MLLPLHKQKFADMSVGGGYSNLPASWVHGMAAPQVTDSPVRPATINHQQRLIVVMPFRDIASEPSSLAYHSKAVPFEALVI